jgi:hypothetical protein
MTHNARALPGAPSFAIAQIFETCYQPGESLAINDRGERALLLKKERQWHRLPSFALM